MKNFLLLAACFFVFASSAAAQATSLEYAEEAGNYYRQGSYKEAAPLYQKAFDLEQKKRKLPRADWIAVVDNLATSYRKLGGITLSITALRYGISAEPAYPLFYYNLARSYADLDIEQATIEWLRLAYKHKANTLPGEKFPDPETDPSFEKFRDSEKFKNALAEMKNGK